MRCGYAGRLVLAGAVSAFAAACGGVSPDVPPGSPPSSQSPAIVQVAASDLKGSKGALELLELEIAGEIPVPIARPVLLRMLDHMIAPRRRPQVAGRRDAAVGLWADVTDEGYIFGQDSKGNKTLTAIDSDGNGCLEPYSIKVDHSENLWVACYESNAEGGAVQVYSRGSQTPSATYADFIPCGSGCFFLGTPFDVATDASAHVFAANSFSEKCHTSCTYFVYPVVWWNAAAPSSLPTGIKDPNLTNGDYVDVDASGYLYVAGNGCIESNCGYLVDEISNPATSPSVTNLIPPSTYSSGFGPLYVSNGGTVLNLVNSGARTMSQFALPWMPSESPFKVLGPTLSNYFNEGYPEGGGFNHNSTLVAIGDAYGWLDVGKVSKNRWSLVTNANLFEGVFDAAYVPSDK